MIKHVWFDMGGTLYRETPEFNIVHDKYRYSEYAKLKGVGDLLRAKQEYDALYKQYGSNSAVFTSLGMPSDFWQRKFEQMDLSKVIHPDSEVLHTLTAVKELVSISLFTNFRPQRISEVLTLLQIPADDFTNILSGDDISRRKPNLEGFRKMIELSMVAPDQILYVGDRVDVDIKPAKQLGMQTCLVWSESTEADFNALTFRDIEIVVKSNSN